MSEKRILCLEVSGECRNFAKLESQVLADFFDCKQGLYCTQDIPWKPITKATCKICKHAKFQGITREQAIRKMCDGYFKAKDEGKTESVRVEAALNALLEGHDDGK